LALDVIADAALARAFGKVADRNGKVTIARDVSKLDAAPKRQVARNGVKERMETKATGAKSDLGRCDE
jgi:hypothetical protein